MIIGGKIIEKQHDKHAWSKSDEYEKKKNN